MTMSLSQTTEYVVHIVLLLKRTITIHHQLDAFVRTIMSRTQASLAMLLLHVLLLMRAPQERQKNQSSLASYTFEILLFLPLIQTRLMNVLVRTQNVLMSTEMVNVNAKQDLLFIKKTQEPVSL